MTKKTHNLTIKEGIELAIMILGTGAVITTYYLGNTEHPVVATNNLNEIT